MELDELKAYWNMQEREIEKQKLTIEKLNNIIMKATTTLGEIQAKNVYWSKLGIPLSSAALGVMLVYWVILYFAPKPHQTFGESSFFMAVIIVFFLASVWVYKKQQQIFDISTEENLKEVLKHTISNFRRFYIIYNLVYLFLFPVYIYAFIKMFLSILTLSTSTVWLTCVVITIVSLIFNHWYYSIHYFKKIKTLEENLNELT